MASSRYIDPNPHDVGIFHLECLLSARYSIHLIKSITWGDSDKPSLLLKHTTVRPIKQSRHNHQFSTADLVSDYP